MKKKWKKPQVNVIVRGRLEESVLGVCKRWCYGGPTVTHCHRAHRPHHNRGHYHDCCSHGKLECNQSCYS